jgi:hypothetical protein
METIEEKIRKKERGHEAGIPDVWGRHAWRTHPFITVQRRRAGRTATTTLASYYHLHGQSNAFETDILGSIIANLLSNLSEMGSGDLEEHCAALKQVNYTNFVFSL